MATRQARRSCWEVSPREKRRPAAPDPPASPPVLSLSHFCRPPFLCFGDVRLGTSRTLPLALDNPNEEVAQVEMAPFPAAERGFSVSPRSFVLQPKEKIVISVNWTPLEEGRVREIVTFIVNNVLKHQAVLLGNAEEKKKKKRSIWDTISKKKVLTSSSHNKKVAASSDHNKRNSSIQNVNKTFTVSQKIDKVRSPLQACENLAPNECCSPTEKNSLVLEDNEIPISPISPAFKECHDETRLLLSVRRSTTYTSLHASENEELLRVEGVHILKDFSFDEKFLTETSFNTVNNLKDNMGKDGALVPTPNRSSTLNMAQSQGYFLSPDSFVNNSHPANNEPELATCLSSDTFIKDSKPVDLESKSLQKIYQAILSPDSFVKGNYELNQDLESDSVHSILSPSQFLKDNMEYLCTSQQASKLSPLSNENSHVSQSQDQRKNEVVPYIPECQDSKLTYSVSEESKAVGKKSSHCSFTQQNQPKSVAVEDCFSYSHEKPFKRQPILSSTVIKKKPSSTEESQTESNKIKAKRCLHGAVREVVTGQQKGKDALRSNLPIIDPPLNKSKSHKNELPPSLVARKRKSEANTDNINMRVTITEPTVVQDVKRIHFSPVESKTSTFKKTKKVLTPVSKRTSNREKLNLKKKSDSLVYRTPHSKASKIRPIVGVAQSSLTFIRPLKTDIPRHPMPFAAKNMFYDERWKEKQEQGFTWWLNFILTPDDFTVKTNVSQVNAATILLGVENQHKLSVPRAPTKDEMSLRAYTARCRLNRLRRAACCLFTSEKLFKAIKKLEIEIEARRLIVRKDKHLWKDVGERQKVLNWLLSYNPLWLRIGLETVYGELISLEDNSDVTGLAIFILNRLLWNPDIAAEYRHPTVPHLYRDGHEEALAKFTLKKFLLLVCFLDYAKFSRLIDHDPCLFCKDAEFKASKDILLAFSRDFLSGEGNLSRHLALLGLPVNHVQTPLDEFDFAVTNLAVDLQCGVRLVRAMEILTQNWNLSKKLRIPAISRLQKMHNVDIVLQILQSKGIQLNDEHGNTILAKDIVDRHREKTLALLWKIALAFQVDISINVDQLKEEINFLKDIQSTKKAISALSCHSDTIIDKKKDKGKSASFEHHSESIKLLMDWVNAVCAFYSKKVENFTVSFSDGRVLCYLIHHYHPCYVPFHTICQRTTQTVECTQTGSVVLNSSSESDEGSLDISLKALDHENTSELYKELLENEKKNFQLVRSAARDLGGIPAMIHHSDMSNTIPDEKVVITYLSFLCARLLDLRKETRAARVIQATWRKYKLKRDLKLYQERDKAARIIQSAAMNFLTKQRLKKELSAALTLQKYWRRFLAQRKLSVLKKEKLEKAQNKSASIIQSYWRRYSTRKKFLKLRHYSVILQARIRMIIAMNSHKRHLWAAVTIQRHWRACLQRKHDQERYKKLKSSSLVIQCMFRRWKRRKMQLQRKATVILQRAFRDWHARKRAKEEKCAVVIQSWYRMHRELQKYTHIRSCAILIQASFRRYQTQKLYKMEKASILTLQRHCKAYLKGKLARENYLQKRAAAIQLQAAFRGMKARTLCRQIRAACVLQSYWRMRQARLHFLYLRKIVIGLQAHVRRHQQLQKYKKMKKSVIILQVHFRACLSARKVLASYQRTRCAVIVLQSAYRRLQARRKFVHILTSVVKIQSYYRAYSSRKKFLHLKNATIKLQSIVRMQQTLKRYLHVRAATMVIQQWYRSIRMTELKRKEYIEARESCIKLQALVRGYLVRKQVRLQRKAAISLQAYFRMRKLRQHYLQIYRATLVIQSYYHAYRAQVNQRKKFLQVKRATTCLQAAYRSYRVRQLIKHQSKAALKIQTAFRGYSKRVKYQAVLQSAIKIQQWYRAHKTAYEMRRQFLKTRRAVISLQSAFRGWKVREQIRREHKAAVKIQSAFKMAKARKQYSLLKTAAVVIQRHLRAWTTGKKQRKKYIELRHAVVRIQSMWRGQKVRRQIQKQQECAVIIQANYRMYVQKKKWTAMRKAAHLIQMYYRAHSIAKKQRHFYLKAKAAVIILQSAYRGLRVREQIKTWDKAAVTIQSNYRTYKAKKKYAAYRASAIIIQRWYRNTQIANHQRKEYLCLKKTAIKIQAVYRGVRVRKHIQHMHKAATAIKAMFKMHQSERKYHKMRTAAILIQRRYRAYYQGKIQRAKYLTILKAVNTLQASFRRFRQTLRKKQNAATLIQSYYRRYRQQKYFNQLKKVTRIVQQKYRAIKERNAQFQRYNKLRHSVICIQAIFRGMRTRRHIKVMHLAATLIQRRFRALMTRRRFLCLRKSAVWVQRKYRANVCAKRHFQHFLQLRKATITIQSSYRGWMVRKKLQEMHRSATLIQAAFRMHTAHVRYQALHWASVLIQQRYQANRAAERQRQIFLQHRHSALILQAAFRGLRARRHLRRIHSSAALIQSRYRSLVVRRRFISLKKAAVFVQRKYRATICAKHHFQQFLQLRKAAIIIQSSYRGWMVRKKLQEMHRSATLIQAAFRMHTARVRYQALRWASVLIQQRYQANRAAERQRQIFLQHRHSALILQAAFRGLRARRHLRRMHSSAALIQSRYRSLVVRRRFISLKKAAVFVQRKYRATIYVKHHLNQFLELQKAAITIQSCYRRLKVKKKLQEMHRAAVLIQATFRMHRTYVTFHTWKHASAVIQQHYRAYRAAKLQRENYIRQRHSALVIQAAYKGMKVRQLLREKHRAAIIIQSTYRMHRQYYFYQKVQWATKVIQEKYRANKNQRALQLALKKAMYMQAEFQDMMLRQQIQEQHQAAIIVQKHFKAFKIRKRYLHFRAIVIFVQRRYRALAATRTQAAVCIQSFYRGFKVRRQVQLMHLAATVIQAFYRMHRAQVDYQAKRTAVVIIQNFYRSYITAKMERNRFLAVQKSTRTIQAAFRGMRVRQILKGTSEEKMAAMTDHSAVCWDRTETQDGAAILSSALDTQKWYSASSEEEDEHSKRKATEIIQRAFCEMVTRKLEAQMHAALQIQSFLQMVVCRRRFIQQKTAALTLQQYFRTWKTRKQFLQYRNAAVVLQNHYRALVSAKHQREAYLQMRSSIIIIQASTKGFIQKRKFQKIKDSTIKIQATWRRYKARKYLCEVKAACKIQAWYRCWKARKEYLAVLRAITIIQGYFYTKQERTRFLNVRASAIIIQRKWRATLSARIAREQFLMMKLLEQRAEVRLLHFTAAAFCHLSALKIQRAYRLHLAIKNAKKVNSVICIQRWFRARLQQKRFIQEYHSFLKLQHEIQEPLSKQNWAASVIQKAVRRFLLHKKQERLNNGIIKIQALWRGYSWRKENDCTKIKAIRLSLQVVNNEVREENKLYKRTAHALHYLLTYKHISAVLEALKHLEVVTRLSPNCCEKMAQSGAISKIFVLIRSCNRSIPCMEVVRYAIQVLLNVAKYEKTTSAICDVENCIDTLLELMQMYREKPGDRVADKGGSIFTKTCCLLAILLKTTNQASDVRSRSKIVDRIYSLYKLTVRKQKLNAGRMLMKQRTSSVNIPFVPETPVRARIVSRLKPDWVLRRDNVEEITNPLQAIQMVMDTLGLPY
ncbi:abnormal spindle-like microcephaly-associated protein [Erinaceus europaeus]|uniref:Abnormal spindle-like microcephaly-associated protein n=1 Tax=Erinaceus europaeus TaxID=9365 RepID=A0ABM3WD13_ERIEU|nr:abnormal spindle-like microcephaly-associated protein [Erinaceus europaeus]